MDDENLGLILATAGLYEIEELIAEIQDEDPLFGEFNFEKELVPKEEKNEVDHAPEVSAIPGVKLVVTLEVSSKKGLLAIPKWKLSEQEEVSVYGSKSEGSLQDADRPALMRFVAEANEKGFSFNKENGTFLLSDWNQIALLTQESLPKWEQSFSLKFEGDAQLLKHGQRTLNWEIEARSESEGSMTLRERFQLGSHKLGRASSRRISKAKLGATFIRGHGCQTGSKTS